MLNCTVRESGGVLSTDISEILARAAALARVAHSDYDEPETARRRLNAHGLDDGEIARQLATLSANSAGTPAVLTSYSLLRSLQHIDELRARVPRAPEAAEAALTLLRCAEVCVGALARLAARMQANLAAGNGDRAVANARWRTGIGQLLYRRSALLVETGGEGAGGATLAIADSRAFAEWRRATAALRDFLRTAWPESPADIFARGLDDARRFVFFHEFVDTGNERT